MDRPSEPETEPSRSSAVRGDDTRQALLQAAHDLLASEGPEALTVRRIAAAAAVSTMNVYSRFGGKDGVVEELFLDGFRRLREQMAKQPITDDPIADLRACAANYRRFARANPTYYSVMFERAVPGFEPSPSAREAAKATISGLVEQVERAMATGAFAAGDAQAVAASLWACSHGLASLEMHRENDDLFDWDRIHATAVDAILHGLAAVTEATD